MSSMASMSPIFSFKIFAVILQLFISMLQAVSVAHKSKQLHHFASKTDTDCTIASSNMTNPTIILPLLGPPFACRAPLVGGNWGR